MRVHLISLPLQPGLMFPISRSETPLSILAAYGHQDTLPTYHDFFIVAVTIMGVQVFLPDVANVGHMIWQWCSPTSQINTC